MGRYAIVGVVGDDVISVQVSRSVYERFHMTRVGLNLNISQLLVRVIEWSLPGKRMFEADIVAYLERG